MALPLPLRATVGTAYTESDCRVPRRSRLSGPNTHGSPRRRHLDARVVQLIAAAFGDSMQPRTRSIKHACRTQDDSTLAWARLRRGGRDHV